MKFLSIIFFLLTYTNINADEKTEKWLTLGSTENTIFYYDVNSIENEIPDIFKIEILFNSTTNKKIKSIRSFRTINCKNNTERAIITWYYQKKMGIGKPVRTEHFGAYNKITPDSAADLLRKKLCKY